MHYLDYTDLANPRKEDSHHTYDFLKDVPVIVSAEVARKNMTIRDHWGPLRGSLGALLGRHVGSFFTLLASLGLS